MFQNFTRIRPVDATIGFVSLGAILMLRNLKKVKCGNQLSGSVGNDSRRSKCLKHAVWLITVSRNTIVLLLTSLLAYYLIEVRGMNDVIEVTGNVKGGMPSWWLPWKFTNHNSMFETNDNTYDLEIHTNHRINLDTYRQP